MSRPADPVEEAMELVALERARARAERERDELEAKAAAYDGEARRFRELEQEFDTLAHRYDTRLQKEQRRLTGMVERMNIALRTSGDRVVTTP